MHRVGRSVNHPCEDAPECVAAIAVAQNRGRGTIRVLGRLNRGAYFDRATSLLSGG